MACRSVEETEALIEGVHLVGVGKWAEIKKLPLAAVSGVLLTRSAVDLKDKWRNLVRPTRRCRVPPCFRAPITSGLRVRAPRVQHPSMHST